MLIGTKCRRLEPREDVEATVLGAVENDYVLIEYSEGGQGWWPLDCLTFPDTDSP